MTKAPKVNLIDALMQEPIRCPGVPQLIVTRACAHAFLKRTRTDGPGFGSIDYAVFSPKPVSEPLTDPDTVAQFLAAVERDLQGAA